MEGKTRARGGLGGERETERKKDFGGRGGGRVPKETLGTDTEDVSSIQHFGKVESHRTTLNFPNEPMCAKRRTPVCAEINA